MKSKDIFLDPSKLKDKTISFNYDNIVIKNEIHGLIKDLIQIGARVIFITQRYTDELLNSKSVFKDKNSTMDYDAKYNLTSNEDLYSKAFDLGVLSENIYFTNQTSISTYFKDNMFNQNAIPDIHFENNPSETVKIGLLKLDIMIVPYYTNNWSLYANAIFNKFA